MHALRGAATAQVGPAAGIVQQVLERYIPTAIDVAARHKFPVPGYQLNHRAGQSISDHRKRHPRRDPSLQGEIQ